MRTLHRLLTALGALVFIAFMAVNFTPLTARVGTALRVSEEPRAADAIVVLGAGRAGDADLSRASLRRAIRGITLHHEGYAPLLVMLGPKDRGGESEAALRARLAERLGVEPSAVIVEDRVDTTRDEVRRTWERLEPHGARSILLVTDSQHLIRAKPLFENAGFDVTAVAADDVPPIPKKPLERMELTKRILQEWVARIYYRLAGYL